MPSYSLEWAHSTIESFWASLPPRAGVMNNPDIVKLYKERDNFSLKLRHYTPEMAKKWYEYKKFVRKAVGV